VLLRVAYLRGVGMFTDRSDRSWFVLCGGPGNGVAKAVFNLCLSGCPGKNQGVTSDNGTGVLFQIAPGVLLRVIRPRVWLVIIPDSQKLATVAHFIQISKSKLPLPR